MMSLFLAEQLYNFIKISVTFEFDKSEENKNLHAGILEAMKNKDLKSACNELKEHLDYSYNFATKYFNKLPKS
jgi:hypothetical protein